ncbi:helix-turn-helix domain-containing protein [Mesorhizobium sp.]|uniref:helix-turn-helix domain-containing protein n=1 Tax=Mesorhizobium sp. TaxID=1871066 RepID=UPI00257B2E5E|nr:helix-turn-helix domain-containing protein [Mesorhizobium sp.]
MSIHIVEPLKGGRPATYRPAAAALAEQGATLAEIADALKTTVRTVSRWRLNYPEFREALDHGRHKKANGQTDAQLARAAIAQRERDRLAAAKAAGEAAFREAALELKQLLASAAPPLSGTPAPPDAPGSPASRLSERRAVRQAPAEPEEPQGWQGGDGEPVPLDDPRSEW